LAEVGEAAAAATSLKMRSKAGLLPNEQKQALYLCLLPGDCHVRLWEYVLLVAEKHYKKSKIQNKCFFGKPLPERIIMARMQQPELRPSRQRLPT
jgi:hypothetical protein